MKILREFMYKVFVGCCDTYEAEDYAFVGSLDECKEYIEKYNHQKESYIEPAGYTRGVAIAGLCEGRHAIEGVNDYVFGKLKIQWTSMILNIELECGLRKLRKLK